MESGAVPNWASVENLADLEKKGSESESPETQRGNGRKNLGSKESGHLLRFSINKFASQFKKSPHRRSASPHNWFPRKKTDSFLKRKIRRLQEVGGMNSTLDETLGNANPHYTRMTREKIAAREAAKKAMEARKAAMVEASWCRILRAARIQSREAEHELEKAEKCAVEAFEAARAMGVMMYDRPDCPRRSCEIESSSAVGGGSTHKVTTTFETAFEVDKEVAAAVKRAFVLLANCPSSSEKEEFRDLLRKISRNPEGEMDQEMTRMSSKDFDFNDNISKSCMELVGTMLDRLKGLQEDELASLAIIVATCGLNAALLEVERSKGHYLGSSVARRSSGITCFIDGHMKGKEAAVEVPSLDKLLVKHVSRLEREVQEARNVKESNLILGGRKSPDWIDRSVVKHISRIERAKMEVLEAFSSIDGRTEPNEPAGLDQILVKPISRLEREKLQLLQQENGCTTIQRDLRKQLTDTTASESLDKNLVKHVSGLEKERMAAGTSVDRVKEKKRDQGYETMESLSDILVKHESELEKAKSASAQQSEDHIKHVNTRRESRDRELQKAWGGLSLGNSIRPSLSRLERDKAAWRREEEEERRRARVL